MQGTGCLASFVWQCCVSLLVIGRYKQLAERLVIKSKIRFTQICWHWIAAQRSLSSTYPDLLIILKSTHNLKCFSLPNSSQIYIRISIRSELAQMVICHIMRRELQLQSSSSSRTVSTLSPLNRLIYQSATVKMAWERSEEKEMLQHQEKCVNMSEIQSSTQLCLPTVQRWKNFFVRGLVKFVTAVP